MTTPPRRSSWSGTVPYHFAAQHRPTDLDALRSLVARTPALRPLGTAHTFNDLPDGAEAVDLGAFEDVDVAEDRTFVRVGAGLTHARLAEALAPHGLALENLASLPHLNVVGAVATATHGSGARTRNLATQVRALDQHHFMGATVTRGSGRGVTHGDDQRSGRISAYTLAFLQDRYPAASTTWAAPEWFAHEMVIERDTCVTERPATPATHWESRDHHPTELCADAATGSFVTCGAGTNPSFTLQFSSKSAENCTAGAHARLTIDGVEVARGATVTPDCTDPLRQYTWTVAPTILQSTLPAGPLPRTVPAVLEVVSASPTPEGDASDNAVRLELTLQP